MTQLPPITFTSPSNSNAVLRANAYIDQWKTVLGVNIKSNPIPDDQFSKILSANAGKTSLQIWEYGWQDDYPDPQDWITKFFDKGADVNYENYGQNNSPQAAEQQALQKQMEAADINQDTTARAKAYNAIEAQLEKEVAYIPIAQLTSYYVLNPKIHGYQENAFGLVDPDDWGNIYVTQ
jgi:peptide/nickel transport system substrate-binding protein/oligopeptide transport system substrate-binding protein